MCDRDLLDSIEWLCSGSNIVDGVKNIGAVIPGSTRVTNPDNNIFKDDESLLMLKGLPLNLLRPNGSLAVFTAVTVTRIVIALWRFHRL